MATTSAAVATTARQDFNLLQSLKIWLVLLVAVDSLFFYTLWDAQRHQAEVVQEIGVRSAPSVIAARKIAVFIADMEAEAANEMLSGPEGAIEAKKAFDKRRGEAAAGLIDAAKNITYDGEEKSILTLQQELGDFETAEQQARDYHTAGDARALAQYRSASAIVTDKLLPEAENLNKINDDHLSSAYDVMRAEAQTRGTLSKYTGLLLLALLIWAQVELRKRTRRLLNPALVAASLVILLLTSYSAGRLADSNSQMKRAKQDAFDSLKYLWQARALAFAANSDESKYLLGGSEKVDADAFAAKDHEVRALIQKELGNITFKDEHEDQAAAQTAKAWDEYIKIDKQIRDYQRTNQHAKAVALCLGREQGESDYAFEQFDQSLMRTIKINDDAFQNAITTGKDALEGLPKAAAFGTGLIALLCSLGLFVRIPRISLIWYFGLLGARYRQIK